MEPSEQEIDRLMAALADGDRAAFDPLFRALHPRAVRVARARLDPAAADDAAQAALVKVFARASEFTAGRPALPWFYAVVANEIRGVARERARHAAKDEPPLDQAAGDADPEAAIVRRELVVALDRALDSLDATSAESIAALLGEGPPPAIAKAALRKRLSRAYAHLRLLLGAHREE